MRRFIWLALAAAPALAWAAPPEKAADKPAEKKGEAAAAPAPGPEKKQGASAAADFSRQLLKATGQGAPDIRRQQSPAAARIQAERAAETDALRRILEQVKGLQVSGGKTVGDRMASNEELGAAIQGVVKGWKVTDKRYFSDGGVEVDVEVMFGDVLAELGKGELGSHALASSTKSEFSGVVVDASGLKLSPALMPRLVDEDGKELYGPSMASPDWARKQGLAAYVSTLDAAKKEQRVGEKPLVVKASKVSGSDIVLSKAEAEKLRSPSDDRGYLGETRVVIVSN